MCLAKLFKRKKKIIDENVCPNCGTNKFIKVILSADIDNNIIKEYKCEKCENHIYFIKFIKGNI